MTTSSSDHHEDPMIRAATSLQRSPEPVRLLAQEIVSMVESVASTWEQRLGDQVKQAEDVILRSNPGPFDSTSKDRGQKGHKPLLGRIGEQVTSAAGNLVEAAVAYSDRRKGALDRDADADDEDFDLPKNWDPRSAHQLSGGLGGRQKIIHSDTPQDIDPATLLARQETPEPQVFATARETRWDGIPLGATEDREVYWETQKHAHMLISGPAGSGKTNLQTRILQHCATHPGDWEVFVSDIKGWNLREAVQEYGNPLWQSGESMEEVAQMIRDLRDMMKARYAHMESEGVSYFRDASGNTRAVMIVLDEIYHLLSPAGFKSPEGKREDALRVEMKDILVRIASHGAAAGFHLCLSTHRPDASLLTGGFGEDLQVRIAAGRMDTIASIMSLGNDEAARLNGQQRGQGYYQVNGAGFPFQAYDCRETGV